MRIIYWQVNKNMSKIISQQVTSGQSNKYHEVLLDTYIIVITKNNISHDRALKDVKKMDKFQKVYDLDKQNRNNEIYYFKEVVPMIKTYNIVMKYQVIKCTGCFVNYQNLGSNRKTKK